MISVVGLITACGGSKGIPNKNIVAVGGKPLIAGRFLRQRRLTALNAPSYQRIAPLSPTPRQYDAEVPFASKRTGAR